MADLLSLSTRTADTYRSRLMQKVRIKNLPDPVRFAIRHGIGSPEKMSYFPQSFCQDSLTDNIHKPPDNG
ncbi:MAG: hypothetical protein JXB49_35035 [Bacteroidales bacterium]|nr:hypothetical protein [Bacteroidales bacterium]